MLLLLGSIILSSWLTLSFKVVERLNVPVFQAIVVNYFVCVITGSLVNGRFPITTTTTQQSWFPYALALGSLFIGSFYLIALTAQKIGVAVASVVNKLSLVIPFLFSIYLYGEQVTAFKITGVVLALVAVVFTCMPSPKGTEPSGKPFHASYLIYPALVFFASGIIDTIIKYAQTKHLNPENMNRFLSTCFAVAAVAGVVILLVAIGSGKLKFDKRAVTAGIMIGVPNYFSIWCLVQVLKNFDTNSTAIIPINNTGIVLFSTIAAYFMFKEKLIRLNWIGILLSIAAIALIAYG
jgi:drug/metabolite transporter (DMT)-like permease